MKFSLKKFLLGVTICLSFFGFTKVGASNRFSSIREKTDYENSQRKLIKTINSFSEANNKYLEFEQKHKSAVRANLSANVDYGYKIVMAKLMCDAKSHMNNLKQKEREEEKRKKTIEAREKEARQQALKPKRKVVYSDSSSESSSEDTKPLKKPASSSPPKVVEEKKVLKPLDQSIESVLKNGVSSGQISLEGAERYREIAQAAEENKPIFMKKIKSNQIIAMKPEVFARSMKRVETMMNVELAKKEITHENISSDVVYIYQEFKAEEARRIEKGEISSKD